MPLSFSEEEFVDVVVYHKEAPGFAIAAQRAAPQALEHAQRFHALESIDGYTARIPRSELERLQRDSSVEAYEAPTGFTPLLDGTRSIVQTNSTHAYQVGAVNITGNGIGVCVIDTGVDYTHAALGGCSQQNFSEGACAKVPAGYDYWDNDDDPLDTTASSHGTHVAGIVASTDSTYLGIAPNATILALRACTSASCSGTAMINSIDWCITNKDTYNISVISMSIGDAFNFTSHCDSSSTNAASSFRRPIDDATAANISVVIASGNMGNTSGISSPACIRNATSVGSTTDADAISTFTSRGAILDLLAPGQSVTSSVPTNSFSSFSGTSMATPHVSGAIALLQQYARLAQSRVLTPLEALSALNSTGLLINDSGGSNLNFTRIDTFGALSSQLPANLTFEEQTPANNTVTADASVIISVTANQSLFSALLEWNGTNYSMDGRDQSWTSNQSKLVGNFSYRVFGTNGAGTAVTETRIINFTATAPIWNATLTNLTLDEDANFSLVFSAHDIDGDVITYGLNTTAQPPILNQTNSSAHFNATENFNGDIFVNISATDALFSVAQYFNITVQAVNDAPLLNLSTGNFTVNESLWANFSANASDVDNLSVNFSISGALFDISFSNFTANFSWQTNTSSAGTYALHVNATDGNLTTTRYVNLTVLDLFDSDGDGSPDLYDDDDDNDGIADVNDTLTGNITLLNASNIQGAVNLTINGSNNVTANFSGSFLVNISNNSRTIVSFPWNFSNRTLNLANLSVQKQASGASNGSIVIRGLDLDGATKNVTFDRVNGSNAVCIKDAHVNDVSDISLTCSGANETFLVCPGASGSYNCTRGNESYTVTGLSFSGLREQCEGAADADGDGYYTTICSAGVADCNDNDATKTTDCSTPAGSSGGGGGGGGGSSSGGGGGGAPTSSGTKVSQWFDEVSAGIAREVIVAKSGLAVSNVMFTPSSSASSVTVTITAEESPEAEIDNAYQYLTLTVDRVSISAATIDFSVNRSFADQYDDIILQRYDDGWQKLPTRRVAASASRVNYTATSPGFSLFAITGVNVPEQVLAAPAEQVNQTNATLEKQAAQSERSPLDSALWLLGAIGAGGLLFGVFLFHKLRRNL